MTYNAILMIFSSGNIFQKNYVIIFIFFNEATGKVKNGKYFL
jgi:hypothetical protein